MNMCLDGRCKTGVKEVFVFRSSMHVFIKKQNKNKKLPVERKRLKTQGRAKLLIKHKFEDWADIGNTTHFSLETRKKES